MNIHETRVERRKLLAGAALSLSGVWLAKKTVDDLGKFSTNINAFSRQRADINDVCSRIANPTTPIPQNSEAYSGQPPRSYNSCKEDMNADIREKMELEALTVGVEGATSVGLIAGGATVVLKEFFNRRGRNARRMPSQSQPR